MRSTSPSRRRNRPNPDVFLDSDRPADALYASILGNVPPSPDHWSGAFTTAVQNPTSPRFNPTSYTGSTNPRRISSSPISPTNMRRVSGNLMVVPARRYPRSRTQPSGRERSSRPRSSGSSLPSYEDYERQEALQGQMGEPPEQPRASGRSPGRHARDHDQQDQTANDTRIEAPIARFRDRQVQTVYEHFSAGDSQSTHWQGFQRDAVPYELPIEHEQNQDEQIATLRQALVICENLRQVGWSRVNEMDREHAAFAVHLKEDHAVEIGLLQDLIRELEGDLKEAEDHRDASVEEASRLKKLLRLCEKVVRKMKEKIEQLEQENQQLKGVNQSTKQSDEEAALSPDAQGEAPGEQEESANVTGKATRSKPKKRSCAVSTSSPRQKIHRAD